MLIYYLSRLVATANVSRIKCATTKSPSSFEMRIFCAPTPVGSVSANCDRSRVEIDLPHEIRNRRFESQRNNRGTCATHKNPFFAITPHNIIVREPNSTSLTKTPRVVAERAQMACVACASHALSTRATATRRTRRRRWRRCCTSAGVSSTGTSLSQHAAIVRVHSRDNPRPVADRRHTAARFGTR